MLTPKNVVVALALTVIIPCAASALLARPTMLLTTRQNAVLPATTSAVASPAQKAAVRKVLHCLNALSDTGASDTAVAETHDLMMRLAVGNQSFARDLSGLLTNVLSCKSPNSYPLLGKKRETQDIIPGFPGIPRDLIDRAAAACATRANPHARLR